MCNFLYNQNVSDMIAQYFKCLLHTNDTINKATA